jgi:putative glutamine amidotransferase
VNSLHHQAVREPGKGLRVIAWAEDGVIEAVQSENLSEHYVLGVQWHPERTHEVDDFSLQLFRDFVQAVMAHKRAKSEASQ